jgi:hypothetical protein
MSDPPGGSYLSECHSHNWKFQKNIIGHYLLNSSDIKENRSEAEETAKRQQTNDSNNSFADTRVDVSLHLHNDMDSIQNLEQTVQEEQ